MSKTDNKLQDSIDEGDKKETQLVLLANFRNAIKIKLWIIFEFYNESVGFMTYKYRLLNTKSAK